MGGKRTEMEECLAQAIPGIYIGIVIEDGILESCNHTVPVAEYKLSLCCQAPERLPIQVVAPRQPGVDRGECSGIIVPQGLNYAQTMVGEPTV